MTTKQIGFAVVVPHPSNNAVLWWNNAFAGFFDAENENRLVVTSARWASGHANPAWPLRGMTRGEVTAAIKIETP